MFKRILPVLLLCLVACNPATPRIDPERFGGPPLVYQMPGVERLELANGVRLYLKEDHELPLVRITAMFGAGTIDEPAEKTGLGQLYAAALRTGGAGSRPPADFDGELERLAIDLGVDVGSYATTCDMSVQAGDFEAGMALLADLLRRPRFDSRRVDLARRQLVEQIRRQEDDPGFVAGRALHRALYGEHPLGRTPTVPAVQAVTREDLIRLHDRHALPNELWLGISGDFDRETLMALLERLVGDWAPGDPPPQEIPPLPAEMPARVVAVNKDLPQTTILLGERGIDKNDPDLYALRVMNYILGGGDFNSRLMREVRSNRGLAYSVYSYFQVGRRLPGLFVAGCETRTATVVEVVELMRRLMKEITKRPVSEAELQLAKDSLINSFVFAFDNPHDIVTQTMRIDYYDYPADYLERYRDRIAAVTADQVLAAARRHLHPDGQVVVLVGDRASLGGAEVLFGLPVEKESRLE
jgi:zinc protease